MCPIKNNLSSYSSSLWSCLYYQTKMNGKKSTHGGPPKTIYPTWKNPALFFSRPKQLKLPKVQPLLSQNLPLGSCFIWIIRFYNVEIICGFTSNFFTICSDTSFPFGFPPRSKRPPLNILNFMSLH